MLSFYFSNINVHLQKLPQHSPNRKKQICFPEYKKLEKKKKKTEFGELQINILLSEKYSIYKPKNLYIYKCVYVSQKPTKMVSEVFVCMRERKHTIFRFCPKN